MILNCTHIYIYVYIYIYVVYQNVDLFRDLIFKMTSEFNRYLALLRVCHVIIWILRTSMSSNLVAAKSELRKVLCLKNYSFS